MHISAMHKHTNGRYYCVEVDRSVHLMTAVYWGHVSFWPIPIKDEDDPHVELDFLLGIHDPDDGHLVVLIRRKDIRFIREETRE